MAESKNPFIAAVLGFLFGPFGLFYVSWKQALLAIVLWLFLSAVTVLVLGPVGWILCGVWGYLAANKHNENISHDQQAAHQHAAAQAVFQNLGAAPAMTVPTPSAPAAPASAAPSSFCTACGQTLRAGARFCGACGVTQS
jgi:hypothetical protein